MRTMHRTPAPLVLPAGRHHGTQPMVRRVGQFSLTRVSYGPGSTTPWHSHEAAAFCLVLNGDYVERFPRQQIEGRAADVVFRPPRLEHADAIGPKGTSCFIVEPGPEWWGEADVPQLISAKRAQVDRGPAEWFMRRAMRESDAADAASPIALEGLMLCLLAAMSRAPRPTPSPRRWLRLVRERLDASLTERITLTELAAGVGVHPVHVAATFRRVFGVTVGEYVRRRRVDRARRALADGTRRISEIAMDLGFANPSHFSRIFVRLTGVTPSEYRRSHASH